MSADYATAKYNEYAGLIQDLKAVVVASEARVLQPIPDPIFIDNLNFFTKAYLISLCTCLEAFLQDLAFSHVRQIENRIALAKIPHNVVRWSVSKDLKEKEMEFRHFTLSTSRQDLADELSGNPGKTIGLFKRVGIDLKSSEDFRLLKDVVGAVVAKRNNIIHHNDSATDVSLSDVISFADQFLRYMGAIAACVSMAELPT